MPGGKLWVGTPTLAPSHNPGPSLCELSEGVRKVSICGLAPKIHKSDSSILLEIGWPYCQLNCGWPVPGEQSDQVLVMVRCCFKETIFMWLAEESQRTNSHSRVGAHSVDSRIFLSWILAPWLISAGQDSFCLNNMKVVKKIPSRGVEGENNSC